MNETLKSFLDTLVDWATNAGIKLIMALLVLSIGLKIAKVITKNFLKSKGLKKLDPSVHSFLGNCITVALYATVIVSAALIIGIPAASFVALLGTAGVAVGLALQGAFSNFAGGIMILIFRPFSVGDYIESSGLSGTVDTISIFYTTLKTVDNKHITIPNGTLMNSSVTNYSAEEMRRVDIDFAVDERNNGELVKSILLEKANNHEFSLKDPAIFARLTSKQDTVATYTLRVWCKGENYWTLKLDLLESVKEEFAKQGITSPHKQFDIHQY